MASCNLLLLLRLQRNRRTYNLAGLGIKDPIVERTRLRPPIQFFQPPSHLLSVLFTSIAKFTVWMVDSQEGQQVALQIHDPPRRGIQSIHTTGSCVPRRELIFEAATYYATRRGYGFQQNWVKSRCTGIIKKDGAKPDGYCRIASTHREEGEDGKHISLEPSTVLSEEF